MDNLVNQKYSRNIEIFRILSMVGVISFLEYPDEETVYQEVERWVRRVGGSSIAAPLSNPHLVYGDLNILLSLWLGFGFLYEAHSKNGDMLTTEEILSVIGYKSTAKSTFTIRLKEAKAKLAKRVLDIHQENKRKVLISVNNPQVLSMPVDELFDTRTINILKSMEVYYFRELVYLDVKSLSEYHRSHLPRVINSLLLSEEVIALKKVV